MRFQLRSGDFENAIPKHGNPIYVTTGATRATETTKATGAKEATKETDKDTRRHTETDRDSRGDRRDRLRKT